MTGDRYRRLRENAVFRDGGFARWECARLAIIGGGVLGSRLAPEIVRSGANVWVCDFEPVEPHNLATQALRPGMSKVDAILRACDEIRPGAALGVCADIRHVGVGVLRGFDLLIDCTDDARLAYPLTEIANGLRKPLLRAAVDGSGQWELGRVLCSDARGGGACQLCPRSWNDLAAGSSRTPCPGSSPDARPATRAGNAIAGVVAGLALLQAQRIVTGNDLELVRDREVIVDLSHLQMMGAVVRRSEACVSGHAAWELTDVPANGGERLEDVFAAAQEAARHDGVRLAPFGHPLCIEAGCECGQTRQAVGAVWAEAPRCAACGAAMSWRTAAQVAAFSREQARELGILDCSLAELGLPGAGAMFVVRAAAGAPLRIVLNSPPADAT